MFNVIEDKSQSKILFLKPEQTNKDIQDPTAEVLSLKPG